MLVRILRMYRSKGLSPSLVGFLRTNSQTLRFLCRRFVGWFYHKYCLYRSEGSRTGWKEEFNHDRILTAASAILRGTSGSGMAIWWGLGLRQRLKPLYLIIECRLPLRRERLWGQLCPPSAKGNPRKWYSQEAWQQGEWLPWSWRGESGQCPPVDTIHHSFFTTLFAFAILSKTTVVLGFVFSETGNIPAFVQPSSFSQKNWLVRKRHISWEMQRVWDFALFAS